MNSPDENDPISSPYTVSIDTVLVALKSSFHGLNHHEAVARLEQYGRNTLPQAKAPGVAAVALFTTS